MAVAQSSHRFLPPAYAPFQLRYRLSFLSRSHLSTLNSSTLIAAASPIPSPILPLGVISEGSKSWLSSCPAKLERFPSSGRHSSKWVLNIWNQSVRFAFSAALALGLSLSGLGIADAKVGVNKPELLPKEFTPLIDVAGFLSSGQENRLIQEIIDIEKGTGFKLRVLAQNYPDTPGLAVRDFWQVDDRTIVFVADPSFGNILNFNVGALVDIDIPRSFWSRLAGKYGNMFYWKEKGEDASIEAAVMAISSCLREPVGPSNCLDVK